MSKWSSFLTPVLRGKQPGPPPQRNDARRPIVWTRRPCEDSNCMSFNFQFDSPVVEIFQTVWLIFRESSFLHLCREGFFWPGVVSRYFLWYQLHCSVSSNLQTWIIGCHTCRTIVKHSENKKGDTYLYWEIPRTSAELRRIVQPQGCCARQSWWRSCSLCEASTVAQWCGSLPTSSVWEMFLWELFEKERWYST